MVPALQAPADDWETDPHRDPSEEDLGDPAPMLFIKKKNRRNRPRFVNPRRLGADVAADQSTG